jgi:predicted transglutaminase-like cysteine proteinase
MTGMGVIMHKSFGRLLVATVGLGLMVQQASALPARIGLGIQDGGLPIAGHLVDGSTTAAPAAFVEFCMNYSSQCQGSRGGSEMALDAARWAELQSINASVNQRIVAKSDPVGEDHWTLGVNYGDCDDYAVQKRQALEERGWSPNALSLTAAYLPSGEGHLVLVVRTDRGEFVLDNLRDTVLAADRVHYRWVARQSPQHPQLWVRVNGSRHDGLQMVKLRHDEQSVAVTQVAASANPTETTGGIVKVEPKAEATVEAKSATPDATLQNYLLNR